MNAKANPCWGYPIHFSTELESDFADELESSWATAA
jgi:hypothetical protein